MILWVLIYGQFFLGIFSGNLDENAMAAFEPNFLLMMVFYIVEIAITALMPVAFIRFARIGTFAEAFNFSAIFATIAGIGWLNYIIALVLVYIVVSIPIIILIVGFILVGGASLFILKEAGVFIFLGLLVLMILLILALAPLVGIFQARYMTRLYDSAAPA